MNFSSHPHPTLNMYFSAALLTLAVTAIAPGHAQAAKNEPKHETKEVHAASTTATAANPVYSVVVHAQQNHSLVDLFQAAKAYDSTYRAIQKQADVTLAKVGQAKAASLPNVNLQAGASHTEYDASNAPQTTHMNAENISVVATHSLYRRGIGLGIEQANLQADFANAQIASAEQDLMLRTATAYFDALNVQENLKFIQAQKIAVTEQLAFAKRNFEVGTSTITDTREAEARFDLTVAQELAAMNDVRVKTLALEQLTGVLNVTPKPIVVTSATLPAVPTLLQATKITDAHPLLMQAKLALKMAELDTTRAKTGYTPTVDLNASIGTSYNQGVLSAMGKITSTNNRSAAIGVVLNWPLFTGYAVENRIKETLALQEKAQLDILTAQRNLNQSTTAAFYGLQSGTASVKALEAAQKSTQTALDANQLGYKVGVRINIDVLNAQILLFQTQRDLSKARFDVLLAGLKLRQANGTLVAKDLAF